MKLSRKQRDFMAALTKLLTWAHKQGYEFSGGDLFAKTGHIDGSYHYRKLAIDLNLFKDGVYLQQTSDHKIFGEFWESLHPLCSWGGRFNDGNHYSIEHNGRK